MANGEIVIRFEEGEGNKQKVDATGEDKKKNTGVLDTAFGLLALKKSFNILKKVSVDEVKYQLNRYYRLSDDYLGQQDMQLALNTINEVASDALGFAASLKLGSSVGGPAGAVIMGGIYAGGLVLTKVVQNNRKINEERLNINRMNTELQYNRQRAGYSLTAGATGENK